MSALYETVRDFQTLISAGVALTAACIAYRGAMLKLRFDRDEAASERKSEKLALFLQLQSVIEGATSRLDTVYRADAATPVGLGVYVRLLSGEPGFPLPPEIDGAWKRLDLFTPEQISAIVKIRQKAPWVDLTLKRLAKNEADQLVVGLFKSEVDDLLQTVKGLALLLAADIETIRS
ncbi:hypothetical protein [Bradyrhizobium sp. 25ACV]